MKVIKKHEYSNHIVEELNAVVLMATFPDRTGIQKADLYRSVNSSDTLVKSGACAPVGSEFIGTYEIDFGGQPAPQRTREDDIQDLCKAVLYDYKQTSYNPNGADSCYCFYCGEEMPFKYDGIGFAIPTGEPNHKLDCAVLLAKDLSAK